MAPLVMVIDDSPTIRKIVEVVLGRADYEVITFRDGVEALRAMTTEQIVPDLILLDICLPKMNGYEIARYIRSKSEWKHIPIVFISRCSGVLIRVKARLVGAQGYLGKPLHTADLLKVVGTLA